MKEILSGNQAIARAAKLARPGVIAAYPITPQTQIVEELAKFVSRGLLKAELIHIESEHSAMAACIGASLTGARVFTATSSQGLAYMHEVLHMASCARAPVVMANVNRELGPPWNIHCSHQDSLSQRDTGWLQFYCESAQEALDTIVIAYKVSENPDILLPSLVNIDGFFLSHTYNEIEIPDQKLVDEFLPTFKPDYKLDSKNPHSFLNATSSDFLMEFKHKAHEAMEIAKDAAEIECSNYEKLTDRLYSPIEGYRADDAEILIVAMGTAVSTIREVVDELRLKGIKIGLLKIWMFRPFPREDFLAKISRLQGLKKLLVIDRDFSLGSGGIIAQEIKSAMYNFSLRSDIKIPVFGFVAGLGGRDIKHSTIKKAAEYVLTTERPDKEYIWLDLKESEKIKPENPADEISPVLVGDGERNEQMNSGHLACQGCGAAVGMRHVLKTLGSKTIIAMPACCWSIINGPFPSSAIKLPLLNTVFAGAAATASGISRALKIQGIADHEVLAWAGDGGTFDIGLQALSGAAERNEDIIYVCYDNEAYMNTGIQRSSATPLGAWTTTTPKEKPEACGKKNIIEIMAAHKIPYAATASVAFLDDFCGKIEKAKKIRGTKFIHLFSPCPPGWKFEPRNSIELARLAVECKIFPLYEIESDGCEVKYRLTYNSKEIPVKEYLYLQGRFGHLSEEEIRTIQEITDKEWLILMKKIKN